MNQMIMTFFKNPIKLFGIILFLLSLTLFFGCNFSVPNYYTDVELADEIAQTVTPNEVSMAVKHLLNPVYPFFNTTFHIFSYSIILFIFCFIFRIDEFKKFREIKLLNNKVFLYLWINLSYLFWASFYVIAYMVDVEKYVYNAGADSLSIPFFSVIGTVAYIGLSYYLISNVLAFITYNTKIKRKIYYLFLILGFIYWLVFAIDSFNWKFSFWHIILDTFYFMILTIIIYAIGFIKQKPNN